MNMQEVREIARNFNIKVSGLNKTRLIQTIQSSEGNFSCFASATQGVCDQSSCIWRDDCFAAARKVSVD